MAEQPTPPTSAPSSKATTTSRKKSCQEQLDDPRERGLEMLRRLNDAWGKETFGAHGSALREAVLGATEQEVRQAECMAQKKAARAAALESAAQRLGREREKAEAQAREAEAKAGQAEAEASTLEAQEKALEKARKAAEAARERADKASAAASERAKRLAEAQAEEAAKRAELLVVRAQAATLAERAVAVRRRAEQAADLREAVRAEALSQMLSRKWISPVPPALACDTAVAAAGCGVAPPVLSKVSAARNVGQEDVAEGARDSDEKSRPDGRWLDATSELISRGFEGESDAKVKKVTEEYKREAMVIYVWEYKTKKSDPWKPMYVGQSRGQKGWFGRTKQHVRNAFDPVSSDFYTRLSARIRTTQASCWRVRLVERKLSPADGSSGKKIAMAQLELDALETKHIVLFRTLFKEGLNSEVVFKTSSVLEGLTSAAIQQETSLISADSGEAHVEAACLPVPSAVTATPKK